MVYYKLVMEMTTLLSKVNVIDKIDAPKTYVTSAVFWG